MCRILHITNQSVVTLGMQIAGQTFRQWGDRAESHRVLTVPLLIAKVTGIALGKGIRRRVDALSAFGTEIMLLSSVLRFLLFAEAGTGRRSEDVANLAADAGSGGKLPVCCLQWRRFNGYIVSHG